MNGFNGGWAQLHGANPLSTSQMQLSVDEDQIADAERSHIAEQVAYIAFGVAPVVDSACSDGIDNDGDGLVDFPADPACKDVAGAREDAKCQDGIDNGGDARVDFDGGQSIHGACAAGVCPPGVSDPDGDGVADPDPQCMGKPWRNSEAASCGLGAEVALTLSGLTWLRQRKHAGR